MRVSVITAVRNGSPDILSTLSSVENQSHPELEHIVVDGASTDDTCDIVRKYGTRVSHLISEQDNGPYDAFNKGLFVSTGEVIGFLGCGDTYRNSDVLAKVVKILDEETVDAVFGDLVIVDVKHRKRTFRRYRSRWFTPNRIQYGFMPAHPTLFIRRSVYQRFGKYDDTYRIAGDFELVARVFGTGRISYAYVPEVLVRMIKGGLSTSGPGSNWTITKEMMRACAQNDIDTNFAKLLLRIPMKLSEVLYHR